VKPTAAEMQETVQTPTPRELAEKREKNSPERRKIREKNQTKSENLPFFVR
jgi:hypothetical protein